MEKDKEKQQGIGLGQSTAIPKIKPPPESKSRRQPPPPRSTDLFTDLFGSQPQSKPKPTQTSFNFFDDFEPIEPQPTITQPQIKPPPKSQQQSTIAPMDLDSLFGSQPTTTQPQSTDLFTDFFSSPQPATTQPQSKPKPTQTGLGSRQPLKPSQSSPPPTTTIEPPRLDFSEKAKQLTGTLQTVPGKPQQMVYLPNTANERLLIDLDQLNDYIARRKARGELPQQPPQTVEDVIKLLDQTMKLLCKIPVDDDGRAYAYASAPGKELELIAGFARKGEGPKEGKNPAACRELAILGQAILAHYGIPSHVQIGNAGVGRHAVVTAFFGKPLSKNYLGEQKYGFEIGLDGRCGQVNLPYNTKRYYSSTRPQLGDSDSINASFFSIGQMPPPIVSNMDWDEIKQICGGLEQASVEYLNLREEANSTVVKIKTGWLSSSTHREVNKNHLLERRPTLGSVSLPRPTIIASPEVSSFDGLLKELKIESSVDRKKISDAIAYANYETSVDEEALKQSIVEKFNQDPKLLERYQGKTEELIECINDTAKELSLSCGKRI